MNTYNNVFNEDDKNVAGTGKESTASSTTEDDSRNKEGETIEETENKNADAAQEAREGDHGKRSYASPGFVEEEDSDQ